MTTSYQTGYHRIDSNFMISENKGKDELQKNKILTGSTNGIPGSTEYINLVKIRLFL